MLSVPGPARPQRASPKHAACGERNEIQRAVTVDVRQRQGENTITGTGLGPFGEGAALPVLEDVEHALLVDQCGVRVTTRAREGQQWT